MRNFYNTKPTDLAWLEREEIIEMISNTFPSKVLVDDSKWTTIVSHWSFLQKDNEMTKLQFKEILEQKFTIYFTIMSHENFMIIRGKNSESIANFVKMAKEKNGKIIDTKNDYTNGNSFSTILEGRKFSSICFSLQPIPKGKDSVFINGDYFSLGSMGCGCDPSVEEESIAYFSDLLIGVTLRQREKIKNVEGNTFIEKLQNSIKQ